MGIYIGGHSLGGARACLYAFSRICRGLPVDGLYVWGCPNPGSGFGGAMLLRVRFPLYVKNLRDLFTGVPIDVKLFGEEYVRWVPTVAEVNQPWSSALGLPDWGVFNDHHAELYLAGSRLLYVAPSATLPIGRAADEMVRLYADEAGWDWLHNVDGEYWAAKRMPSGDWLALARGTVTAHEWLQDFDFAQVDLFGARVSRGFLAGVSPVEAELDRVLAS